MAKDLTIRILGRPQVTKDDQAGFQRISRQYVVEGYRASYAGINDSNNPLFLAVGTEDEEFAGHFLVDQKISPRQGSVDTAYLTREFVEIRDTWSSESFSQSRGFKRISRQYVALRSVNDLGYSQANFQYHPHISAQKEESPWKYLPKVIEDSEPTISEQFDIPIDVQFNQKWHRSSVQVSTQQPGYDVWSVTWTSPIRPEGEPTITKDSRAGYQTVSRAYVLSGEYYSKLKLFDDANALFLPVGTSDHEYANHYLVDQQVKPLLNLQADEADTTEDLGLLTRKYVQIRNTHVSESVSTSNDLKRLRRTYVVLRTNHDLGYKTNWDRHPQNSQSYEPWDYAPDMISNPTPVSYGTADFKVGNKTPTLAVIEDDTESYPSLHSTLTAQNTFNNGVWLKGSTQVDMSQPGVDVWSVEWVTHSNSYLTTSSKRGGGSSFKVPNIVELDENGIRISDFGGSGSSSQINQVVSHVAFFVTNQVPTAVSNYWGGSANYTPSVMFDFYLEGYARGTELSASRLYQNSVYQVNTRANIEFPDKNGNKIIVAEKNPYQITFVGAFDGPEFKTDVIRTVPGEPITLGDGGIQKEQIPITVKETDPDKLPLYKGKPIIHAGGKITYTARFSNSNSYASLIGVTAVPIFSSADKAETRKIWKVTTTYAG